MPAASYNLTIEQGADFIKSFVLKNSDDTIKDLTGYTARMQIRQYVFSEEVEYEATTENAKLLINVGTGTVQMRFPSSDTSAFTIKRGVYDLELIDSSGQVIRLIQGNVQISREVTR